MTNLTRQAPWQSGQTPGRQRGDSSARAPDSSSRFTALQTPVEALVAEPGTADRLANHGSNYLDRERLDDFCTLEVRFNPLGPGYHHAYLVTHGIDGARYFRGGPGRLPSQRPDIGQSGTLISGSGGALSQQAGTQKFASSNSGNSVSAGSGPGGDAQSTGIFGRIEVHSAEYEYTATDWNATGVASVKVAVGSCADINSTLTKVAEHISQRHVPYNPLTANSNSVAREMLSAAGYPDVKPPVWAPGWHKEL